MINRVNQPKRVTCSTDSGGGKHLSESHIGNRRFAKCGRMGGHGKSIGNVIKSSELRSLLLEKYLSAVRCILLMDGTNGFQRQGEIGNLLKKEREASSPEESQRYLMVDVQINRVSPAFNTKNISGRSKPVMLILKLGTFLQDLMSKKKNVQINF